MKFNRKKFFDGYRASFGPLNQETVDNLDIKLTLVEDDNYFHDLPVNPVKQQELAYYFATVYHETFTPRTGTRFKPVKEIGGDDYFNHRYGPGTKVGQNLGNKNPGDGAAFAGRGDVQLTGRRNYELLSRLTGIDFVKFPEQLLDPVNSYKVAMLGMKQGLFTTRKFSHYFKDNTPPNFVGARAIINGKDKQHEIARHAEKFFKLVQNSV